MTINEAIEVLKEHIHNPSVPEDMKEAIQILTPDLERMLPVIPFKGKAGSYMTYNCGYCHTGISSGSKFCYRCGRKVDLEHSDIPAIKEDVIMDLPLSEEKPLPTEKKKRTRNTGVDGQSSIFDMLEQGSD